MLFDLPYPVSTNSIWRAVGGRALLSAEARKWKHDAHWLAKSQMTGEYIKGGPFKAELTVHPKKIARHRMDLDNACKLALDALQGIAYSNDKNCEVLIVKRGEKRPDGGLTVEITALEAGE